MENFTFTCVLPWGWYRTFIPSFPDSLSDSSSVDEKVLNHTFSSLLRDLLAIQSGSLVGQVIKYLPAKWETWIRSLGGEDLEKEMATHSRILAW